MENETLNEWIGHDELLIKVDSLIKELIAANLLVPFMRRYFTADVVIRLKDL